MSGLRVTSGIGQPAVESLTSARVVSLLSDTSFFPIAKSVMGSVI